MSVVKPAMFPLVPPGTSQIVYGVPGLQFSATISLAGAVQGPSAADGAASAITPRPMTTGGTQIAAQPRCFTVEQRAAAA
jgi:hypothetical protein